MTASPEVDRLIVEHMMDLDGAARRVEPMEKLVWRAHAETIEAWCEANGWAGDFDPEKALIATPPHWIVDGERQAWFYWDFGENDAELGLYFDLSRLVGVGGGQLCMWLGYRGLRNPWKAAARRYAEELKRSDFAMTAYGNFFTDCTPKASDMPEALESGDFGVATLLVSRALDRAKAAEPTVSALLRELGAIA